MSYKPEEAVILIVWTKGGIRPGIGGAAWLHSTIADTIRPIGSPSELSYIQANLTARKIPWDETTAANDDISGFGTRVDGVPNTVWQEKITSLVDGSAYTAWEYVASFDKRLTEVQTRIRGADENIDSLQSLAMGINAANTALTALAKRVDDLAGLLAGPARTPKGTAT